MVFDKVVSDKGTPEKVHLAWIISGVFHRNL